MVFRTAGTLNKRIPAVCTMPANCGIFLLFQIPLTVNRCTKPTSPLEAQICRLSPAYTEE